MTIKDAASHPGSLWVTLIAAAGAILSGYADNKTTVESIDSFCHQSENSSYQALTDLRDKLDWIHTRVKANEQRLDFATSPPGGPAQAPPPDTTGGDEVTEETEKPEKVEPVEEKKEPVQLKEDGTIDWAPIERPTEQKGGK